jgi:hypothetical protein
MITVIVVFLSGNYLPEILYQLSWAYRVRYGIRLSLLMVVDVLTVVSRNLDHHVL